MRKNVESKIVSIISDFGLKDPFVGIMKGVMTGIDPDIRFVDLTHLIRAQDVFHGSMALKSAYSWFPNGTVHLAVVDPGVGGTRKGLAIESDGYYFVGPDNGIFSFLFDQENSFSAVELTNEYYFRSPVSSTFHGRDIFAPVAAHLSKGCSIGDLGTPVSDPVSLPFNSPVISGGTVSGEVIYVDKFGNLTTNISEAELKKIMRSETSEITFSLMGERGKLVVTYSEFSEDRLAGVVNSWGMLEIFVNCGNAKNVSGAEQGSTVKVTSS